MHFIRLSPMSSARAIRFIKPSHNHFQNVPAPAYPAGYKSANRAEGSRTAGSGDPADISPLPFLSVTRVSLHPGTVRMTNALWISPPATPREHRSPGPARRPAAMSSAPPYTTSVVVDGLGECATSWASQVVAPARTWRPEGLAQLIHAIRSFGCTRVHYPLMASHESCRAARCERI